MSFEPNPTKQVPEVISKKPFHTQLECNNTNVKQTAFQKHLG